MEYGDGLQLSGLPRSLPSPTYLQSYKMKSATFPHHSASSHICSLDRPRPSPTHGHPTKCAAFCGVQPSHTHHGSSCWISSRPMNKLALNQETRKWNMSGDLREVTK